MCSLQKPRRVLHLSTHKYKFKCVQTQKWVRRTHFSKYVYLFSWVRVLISVSARTYSREYVVLTNVFMRNSFFFFCIAYPFKDIMLLADATSRPICLLGV